MVERSFTNLLVASSNTVAVITFFGFKKVKKQEKVYQEIARQKVNPGKYSHINHIYR